MLQHMLLKMVEHFFHFNLSVWSAEQRTTNNTSPCHQMSKPSALAMQQQQSFRGLEAYLHGHMAAGCGKA